MRKHLYPAYKVEYNGGESQKHAGQPCDYMYVWVPDPEGNEIEFYAEMPISLEDEAASYEPLKAEIIRQAVAAGIDPARLKFWYD